MVSNLERRAKTGAVHALWIAVAIVLGERTESTYSIILDDCTRVIAGGCSIEWAAVLYLVYLVIGLIFFGIPSFVILWTALFPVCMWLTSPEVTRTASFATLAKPAFLGVDVPKRPARRGLPAPDGPAPCSGPLI